MALRALPFILLACAVASASAALPKFENEGAPPFVLGPTTSMNVSSGEVQETGWIAPDAFQFLSAEDDGVRTHVGKYSSWECAQGVSGGYRAVGDITFTGADGIEEKKKTFCEIGIVDTWSGRKWWVEAEDECPDFKDLEAEGVRLDVILTADPAENTCEIEDGKEDEQEWIGPPAGRRGGLGRMHDHDHPHMMPGLGRMGRGRMGRRPGW